MPKTNKQPEKFFEDAEVCLGQLRGIPVVAIESLRNDELSRDVIISILRTCYRICREADIDIEEEIEKQHIRDTAQDSLKEMMSNEQSIGGWSMKELNAKGLKIRSTSNGPIVVPA